jgi:hypothetical protein
VRARSTFPALIAAVALVALAASARAEAPAGAAVASAVPAPAAAPAGPTALVPEASPAPAAPDVAVAPLPVAALPSFAATDVESPNPLVGASGPPKAGRVPLAKRWWFWAGLGTAAVTIVLAAIFLGPKDPYSGNAMPGIATVF